MRTIIFGLAGMFLAGTAVAQESTPTCFGLNREQCRLAPGCQWTDFALTRMPDGSRVCISKCYTEPVYRITKVKDGVLVLRRLRGWPDDMWRVPEFPRELIP
jgi:hypothetical protein